MSGVEHIAVSRFRQYLRINTEHPEPNYEECRIFLCSYAEELGLETFVYEVKEGKPFVGMTLRGTDPSLPSLLLYSHTDVVPTNKECWTHDPYEAFKDEDGNIFARGTQDMKSVGIQYTEALRILQQAGRAPFLRTVHVLWGPDEEIGSHDGMEKFVDSDKFEELNVGFALDEGLASGESGVYRLFYGERCTWWIKVTAEGNPGHGSRLDIEDTAGPKMTSFINNVNEFRKRQYDFLMTNNLKLGDVTSINLTKLEGGVQVNVIPSKLTAYLDLRITPADDLEAMEKMVAGWCAEAGPGVTYEFLYKVTRKDLTPTTRDDAWWAAIDDVFQEQNLKYSKEIFFGGTDAPFLRAKGYKAIGFSPMVHTPILLHENDEFLNEKVFLRGAELYAELISKLANVPDH